MGIGIYTIGQSYFYGSSKESETSHDLPENHALYWIDGSYGEKDLTGYGCGNGSAFGSLGEFGRGYGDEDPEHEFVD